MKIKTVQSPNQIRFADLKPGQTFRFPDVEKIYMRTVIQDPSLIPSSVALEDGMLSSSTPDTICTLVDGYFQEVEL